MRFSIQPSKDRGLMGKEMEGGERIKEMGRRRGRKRDREGEEEWTGCE